MAATAKTAPLRVRDKTPVVNGEYSRKDLYAAGKALRDKCPRTSHASWGAPHASRDPVELVLQAEKGRMPELLPLRHGRMVRSPFTFYRGTALTMASDLPRRPPMAYVSNAAAMLTFAISELSLPRSGGSSSQ
jgi:hypothetical protein